VESRDSERLQELPPGGVEFYRIAKPEFAKLALALNLIMTNPTAQEPFRISKQESLNRLP